jgi:ketosteroid isomerase-like protein
MDAVKAANQAFYTAFSAHDIGAMQKVCSSDADIQNIGLGNKAVVIGWDAIKKGFEGTLSNFPDIKVSMERPPIKVNGSVAWVSGIEHAEGTQHQRPNSGRLCAKFGDERYTRAVDPQSARMLVVATPALAQGTVADALKLPAAYKTRFECAPS